MYDDDYISSGFSMEMSIPILAIKPLFVPEKPPIFGGNIKKEGTKMIKNIKIGDKVYPVVEKPNLTYERERQAEKFVTASLVDKEFAKIIIDKEWNNVQVPKLLNGVYHSIISEDMWEIIKKFKSPTIDFKMLNRYVIQQIKECKPSLFS